MKKTPEQIEELKLRTRTICVLMSIEMTVNVLRDVCKGQKPAMQQLEKVTRWTNECLANVGVGTGHMSAGMLKDCDRISDELDAIRIKHTGGNGTTTPEYMGAWLACLDTLLTDVRATHGVKGACWRYLAQTWEKFAMAWNGIINEQGPAHDPEELGLSMYLEAADIIAANRVALCRAA